MDAALLLGGGAEIDEPCWAELPEPLPKETRALDEDPVVTVESSSSLVVGVRHAASCATSMTATPRRVANRVLGFMGFSNGNNRAGSRMASMTWGSKNPHSGISTSTPFGFPESGWPPSRS